MVLSELVVNKDRMKENLDRTHGLIFSEKVMLALVDKGLTREEAYELAQRNALKAWEKGTSYIQLIKEDEEPVDCLQMKRLKIFSIMKCFYRKLIIYIKNQDFNGRRVVSPNN